MSSLLLSIGLIATFGAILLAGVVVANVMTHRRRPVEILESQIAPMITSPTDLRQVELQRPFLERVLIPFVGGLGEIAKRITPADMRRRIARKLVLAGSPEGWDADKVAALKVFGTIGGGVLGVALAALAGLSATLTFSAVLFGAAFGYLLPGAGLGQRVVDREEAIRRALPDTIDLLTISVEAGLGFDAALSQVGSHVPGPLSQEIGRMLQETRIGVSRAEAFRHLADRTDVQELNGFVMAMIQADVFGVSIAGVLRAQAKEMRTKRRQLAEERAQRLPINLLFPLIFCILPAMFVVILGPGVIRFLQSFLGVRF
jgi:tight adherence protein C